MNAALPRDGACAVCAPPVPGKPFAVLTTSAIAQGVKAWHVCADGKRVTSRAVSWHTTKPAALRAAKAFHRATNARAYVARRRVDDNGRRVA